MIPRITNWSRESRTPTLAYRNTETGVRAVLHLAPDSYRYMWRGAIRKRAASFREEIERARST
jgi:hypothetical protein